MLGFFNSRGRQPRSADRGAVRRRLPARAGLHAAVGRLAVRSAAARRPRPRVRADRARGRRPADSGTGAQRLRRHRNERRQASLADRDHLAYAVANADDPANVLTVRDSVEGARRTIPRDQWQFTEDGKGVRMAAGFEPKKIYEVVYTSQDPPVVGVGLGRGARHDLAAEVRRGRASSACAQGADQARHRVRDLAERPVPPHVSLLRLQRGRVAPQGVRRRDGARGRRGRGSFNHRFAQPSRDGHPYINFFYPTDIFPFTDVRSAIRKPALQDGLLTHATKPAVPAEASSTRTRRTSTGAAPPRCSTRRSTARRTCRCRPTSARICSPPGSTASPASRRRAASASR